MNDECWLPQMMYFDDYKTADDYAESWKTYQEALYAVFKSDFVDDRPYFEGKQVNIRREPIEFGKEEAFFHITCQDYLKDENRVPDLRRCERIKWVRAFIENYHCDPTQCEACEGVKVWSEPHHNSSRVHLLLEEERYMVVLEKREKYCLLITAFYIEHDHSLKSKLQHYEKYKET